MVLIFGDVIEVILDLMVVSRALTKADLHRIPFMLTGHVDSLTVQEFIVGRCSGCEI